jgi:hypothetical protein
LAADTALTSRQLAELHRVAQERLGLTTAATVYAAWSQVSPTDLNPDQWYAVIDDVTRALRRVSARLAARYYTLARAIGSGFALPDYAGERSGPDVRTAQLYEEFETVLNEVISATTEELTESEQDTPDAPDMYATQDDGEKSDTTLDAELDRLEDILLDMFQQLEADAEVDPEEVIPVDTDWHWEDFEETAEDTQDALEDLYTDLDQELDDLEDKIQRELASDRSIKEASQRIDDLARNRGAAGAGMVEQVAMQPGRRMLRKAGASDRRRKAWMRVTGPRPCAFCAMLASRGAVYDSKQSAIGFKDTYHDNCHCVAIPVWTDAPYYSPADQYFIDKWKNEIHKKYFGKDALREWRTRITRAYRNGEVPAPDIYGPNRP